MTQTVHVFGDTHHHNPNMIRFFEQVMRGQDCPSRYLVGMKPGDDAGLYQGLPSVGFYRRPLLLLRRLGWSPRRIIFHSLGSGSAWLMLFLRPDLLSRTTWVVWGADFVSASAPARSWKQKLLAWLRQSVSRRLAAIAVLTPSDVDAVGRVFEARRLVYCPYPILGLSKNVQARVRSATDPLRVLVGNSAGESNRHFALIDLLSAAKKSHACEFVFPLNYAGSPEYVAKVMHYAAQKLPGQCHFLTDMMSNTEYETVLDSIDIIAFNHDRQQGLYVVYYGLLGGKKIYLHRDASSHQSLTALGAHIGSTGTLVDDGDFCTLPDAEQSEKNRSICSAHFTEEACAGRWLKLISGAL